MVDARYLPAALQTYRCSLGVRVGRPRLSWSLAPGPVALAVFDQAYGDEAGGSPARVDGLGQAAYLRNEAGSRSLAVLAAGSVVVLSTPVTPSHEVRARALTKLAASAVRRLPANPVLAVQPGAPPCTDIPDDTIGAALGVPPVRASAVSAPRGAVICSWAGLPGSVVLVIDPSASAGAEARRLIRRGDGLEVEGIDGATAWSSLEQAGDLLLVGRSAGVAQLEVIPAAGWASEDIATTPAELRLAREVAALAF